MSIEAYAKIIYNNFLFDIPKILDICVLYKKNEILPKMIGNLFNNQNRYFEDFKVCLKEITKAFQSAKNNLRKVFNLDRIYSNQEMTDSFIFESVREHARSIIDNIYYLSDFAITLTDLTRVEPKLYTYLHEERFEYKSDQEFLSILFCLIL